MGPGGPPKGPGGRGPPPGARERSAVTAMLTTAGVTRSTIFEKPSTKEGGTAAPARSVPGDMMEPVRQVAAKTTAPPAANVLRLHPFMFVPCSLFMLTGPNLGAPVVDPYASGHAANHTPSALSRASQRGSVSSPCAWRHSTPRSWHPSNDRPPRRRPRPCRVVSGARGSPPGTHADEDLVARPSGMNKKRQRKRLPLPFSSRCGRSRERPSPWMLVRL